MFEWGGQTFGPPCPRRRAKRQCEQPKPAMVSCHLAFLNLLHSFCFTTTLHTGVCTPMSALEEKNERRRGGGSAVDVKRIPLPSNRTVKTSRATSSPSLPPLSPSCAHLCTFSPCTSWLSSALDSPSRPLPSLQSVLACPPIHFLFSLPVSILFLALSVGRFLIFS